MTSYDRSPSGNRLASFGGGDALGSPPADHRNEALSSASSSRSSSYKLSRSPGVTLREAFYKPLAVAALPGHPPRARANSVVSHTEVWRLYPKTLPRFDHPF